MTGQEKEKRKPGRKPRSDKGVPRPPRPDFRKGRQPKRALYSICNPVPDEPGAYMWRTDTHLWKWVGGPRDNFGPVLDGKFHKIEYAANLALAVMFSYGWEFAHERNGDSKMYDKDKAEQKPKEELVVQS